MKVLITGTSGIGKTTVTDELARQGFAAFDADTYPGLARLELRETGEPVDWPEGFIDWNKYSWNLQKDVLKEVLTKDETIFLSGTCSNQPDFYNLFDKLIVLTITPEEQLRRLDARPKRGAGDDPKNAAEKIRKYPEKLQRFIDAGAVPIDASGSVGQTVDAILELINEQ